MKEIQLTKGYVATVDDEDYEFLNQWKWSATVNGSRVYAKRYYGPRKIGTRVYMHRLVMNAVGNNIICDHINRNTLDNRKANLRLCSKKDNNSNRAPSTNPNRQSSFKGVCLNTARWGKKRWRGYIKPSTGQITKLFDTEIEAAVWYNGMAKKYFGEFAYQNAV